MVKKQMKENRRNEIKHTYEKSYRVKNTRDVLKDEKKLNYLHLPILLIIGILPLIVMLKIYDPNMENYTWFSGQTEYNDFFLYYKQNLFIIISAFMLIIAVYQSYKRRSHLVVSRIFIPLAIYAFLALLSTVFSKYSYFSYHGSMDQFESVFAILGYCILVYYVYLNLNSESELRTILKVMIISVLVMGFIGVLQYTGHDLFTSELGYRLIIPAEYRANYGLSSSFGSHRVYMTLFNPNYVGVYVALMLPIMFTQVFWQKELLWKLLSALSLIELMICEFASQSLAGIVGFGVVLIMMIILFRRQLFRKPIFAIVLLVMILSSLIVINTLTNNSIYNKLRYTLQIEKSEQLLTQMETGENGIILTYRGKQIRVAYGANETKNMILQIFDQENNLIPTIFNESTNRYQIEDSQLSDLVFELDMSHPGIFHIDVEGFRYNFTNFTQDGSYCYLNQYSKPDRMITAPSAFFQGYESLASGRGYIWSRTLPLLKNYIFIGSGPDTFTMVFPHNDYMNVRMFENAGAILTKPHSLYLQIGVQTGLVSLIAFLTFIGLYFVSSIRLYTKGRFDSYYSKVGVSIFVGTAAYMVTGLTNDSSITVAPVFWALIGIGIAINQKARILLDKEAMGKKDQSR